MQQPVLTGCYFNTLVNWQWVCRTNTLGWEQCDLMRVESNGTGAPINVHTRIVTSSNAQTAQEMALEVADAQSEMAQAKKNAQKVEEEIKAKIQDVQSEIDALTQSLNGF